MRKANQLHGSFRTGNRDHKLRIGVVTRVVIENECGNRPSKRKEQQQDAERAELLAEFMVNGPLTETIHSILLMIP